MNRRIQALVAAASIASAVAWAAPARAADPAPKTAVPHAAAPSIPQAADVSQTINDQKHIRIETQRATADLDALVQEFDRNGLGDGADVQILKGIRNVLANLSQKNMEQVIGLLESAKQGDAHTATRALADAFSGQQGISLQFHKLLIEYQREQDLADVALRLTRLAGTENENMKSGTDLFRSSKGISPRNYTEIQKAQLQVQHSQQQEIQGEAKILLDRLAQLMNSADPDAAARLKAIVDAAAKEKVASTLVDASDDLKNSNLLSAVGKERTARDALRDLARLASPVKDPIALLKDAADQLAQDIREQNFIAQQDQKVTAPDTGDVNTVGQLDDQQADIVDSADSVKKDVANLTPEAVPPLQAAQDVMQQARQSLNQGHGKDAADKAAAASKQLTDARNKLLAEIARLDDAQKADDKIAEEKALLEQIIALRKREELLQTDTAKTTDAKALADLAPRQAPLLANDQDLQKTAAADVPPVADALGDAGKAMGDTQIALGTQHNGPDSVKNEQVAVDALKKAEALLAADIDRLQKVKDNLAKLEKNRDQVANAVKQETKAELDTNKLAQKDGQKPDPADPKPQDIAPKQDQVAKDATAAAKDVADAAPAAQQPLADAAQNADLAKADIAKPDAKASDPEAKKALNNLQKGLAAIDKQIAQDKKDLNLPDDTDQQLADADQAIDNAINDLDNADTDPMTQMKQQQAQIASDLKAQPQTPDVANAQKAANKAAADLAKNDLDNAAKDMQAAQDGMQNAMQAAQKPNAAKPDAAQAAAAKLPALAAKQADLQQQLAGMQAGDPPPSDDAAANALAQAQANDNNALPEDAQNAMAQAQSDASDAGAEKAAGKGSAKLASRAAAKAALAKAKAAVALAQAGLGQGQALAQGNQPGQDPGNQPGNGKEDPNAKGIGNRKNANVGTDSRSGGYAANGQSAYLGLPPRDRDAIQQSRNEKYPEEYAPMIQQYLKNLSDQTGK